MVLYGLTAFCGAFLTFQVQPMIAKYLLPWFGGGSAVWTTCMLFFQVGLLAGYAYAHLATRHLSPRAQAVLHVALLALALTQLPIAPAASWKPASGNQPIFSILVLLTASVGLPYVALASTAPLVQAWYARAEADPYPLYAYSNTGSLLGLLAYPFLVEPSLTRSAQTKFWGLGFLLFAAFAAFCAVRASRLQSAAPEGAADDAPAPSLATRGLWLALPTCATVLLLAVTNQLCENTASFPLLWLLPLYFYLLSFVLCFADAGLYRRRLFGGLLVLALGTACWLLSVDEKPDLLPQLIGHVLGLFVCCMVCHGELARLQPHPRHVTAYFLTIALGGALGGILVAVVAPLVFNDFFELHVGLLACVGLFAITLFRDPTTTLRGRPRWAVACALAAVLGLAGLLGRVAWRSGNDVVERSRDFYGVLTVVDADQGKPWHYRKLRHGDTMHGIQFHAHNWRHEATTYYGETSGVGLAMEALSNRPARRIGVVGLGIGTLTAYGRPTDHFRFYEIDPAVVTIATHRFTYLNDSSAPVDIVLGDARLSLEREPPQQFDLLVLDAFSSDAIPVHLLTEEAFALYWRHLAADGIVAVHVSNRCLKLEPVVRAIAARAAAESVLIRDEPTTPARSTSVWVLVAKDRKVLDLPAIRERAATPDTDDIRWTDEYANILPVLKLTPEEGSVIGIDPDEDQASGHANATDPSGPASPRPY